MTNIEGIFACGNVLHVHDLVDFVSEESQRCGTFVSDYIQGKEEKKQFRIVPGSNLKYVIPNRFRADRDNHFYMRSLIVRNHAELVLTLNGKELSRKKLRHIQPSEMISFKLGEKDLPDSVLGEESSLEISLVG